MPNPVVHFEVLGKDGKKSQKFYGDLFGWHIDSSNPMNYGVVDTHAGGINGGVAQAPATPQLTFYVAVDDLQKYLDKVEGMGGKTVVPPTVIPNMVTFALFADPDGNVVGMVKDEGQHS